LTFGTRVVETASGLLTEGNALLDLARDAAQATAPHGFFPLGETDELAHYSSRFTRRTHRLTSACRLEALRGNRGLDGPLEASAAKLGLLVRGGVSRTDGGEYSESDGGQVYELHLQLPLDERMSSRWKRRPAGPR